MARKQILKKCIVDSCNSDSISNPEEKFVVFPKYGSNKFYEWSALINKIDLLKGTHYICRNHFTIECFGDNGIRISKNAKPTLNLSERTDLHNVVSNKSQFENPKTYTKYSFNTQDSQNAHCSKDLMTKDFLTLNKPKKTYIINSSGSEFEELVKNIDEYSLLKTPEKSKPFCEDVEDVLCSNCPKVQKFAQCMSKKARKANDHQKRNSKKLKNLKKKKFPVKEQILN